MAKHSIALTISCSKLSMILTMALLSMFNRLQLCKLTSGLVKELIISTFVQTLQINPSQTLAVTLWWQPSTLKLTMLTLRYKLWTANCEILTSDKWETMALRLYSMLTVWMFEADSDQWSEWCQTTPTSMWRVMQLLSTFNSQVSTCLQ